MNWQKAKLAAETLCFLVIAGSAAFFVWDTHQTQVRVRAAVSRLESAAPDPAAVANLLTESTAAIEEVRSTVKTVQPVLAGVKTITDKVNAPCPSGDYTNVPCGTIADLNRTLNTARRTMGTVETAGVHYDQQLETVDQQELQLFGDLHSTIGALPALISQYRDTASSINGWLKSKALEQSAENIRTMTESGAESMSDVHDEIHGFVHPSKKKMTFWTATEAAGDYVRHFMPSIF